MEDLCFINKGSLLEVSMIQFEHVELLIRALN